MRRVFSAHLVVIFLVIITSQSAAAEPPKLPIGIEGSFANSVGLGTFISGYSQAPDWTSSLSLTLSYDLPASLKIPKTTLSLYENIDFAWLQNYGGSIQDARYQIKYSDLSFEASMPKVWSDAPTGFSFTPKINIVGPISAVSMAQSRVLGLNAGGSIKWSKSGFAVSFAPTFNGWVHSGPAKSIACDQMYPGLGAINPHDPDFALDRLQLSSVAYRDQDQLANGKCVLSGRQTLGTLKNTLKTSWTYGAHQIGLSLGWNFGFLRPLESRPDLRSKYASDQGFTETSMGQLAYTYTLPVGFDMSVTGGVLSYQTAYQKDGKIRFPFFDYSTPANNFTQLFVEITAGI